jgi:stearoyl-CoA desaturase (Delta-9 desaturase)
VFDQVTWSVNSICHTFGRRQDATSDESRNVGVVAVMTFGQVAQQPSQVSGSARHGLGRYRVDVSWMLVRGRERLGLVWNVKLPTPERIARRLA